MMDTQRWQHPPAILRAAGARRRTGCDHAALPGCAARQPQQVMNGAAERMPPDAARAPLGAEVCSTHPHIWRLLVKNMDYRCQRRLKSDPLSGWVPVES
jgi:hypothetical protein